MLLALVAERASGQALEHALRERFFMPLSLASLGECPSHPGDTRTTVRGHRFSNRKFTPHEPENFHLFRGSGGFCGNALDLAHWLRALVTGRALGADSSALMTTPVRLNNGVTADYGMALALASPDGLRRIGHGGYGGGFSDHFAYYPERDLTVVIMVNRFPYPESIERRISRRLLELEEDKRAPVAVSAAERAKFTGSYDLGVHGWYPQIVEAQRELYFEVKPFAPQALVYVGQNEFAAEGDPYGYRFYFGPEKPEREVRMLTMGMMSWYGLRRP